LKILIIRPAALGDTLMLMPAIVPFRVSSEIILVGRSPGLDFLGPYVHGSIDYEGPGWHRLFQERPVHDHPPPIPPVDRAAAFLSDPEGNVEKNLKACLSNTPVHIFPPFPPKGEKIHVALYLARCLEMAGFPVAAEKSVDEASKRPLFEKKAGSMKGKRIIFHPGSGGEKKNHPPFFWMDLMKVLRKSLFPEKEKFVLLLGPAEERFHRFFRQNLSDKDAEIIFCPENETIESLLRGATLYLGHDSGITHLAAMLGTPTIVLFKNTSVRQWRPLGPAVRIFKNEEIRSGFLEKILKEASQLIMGP